MIYSTIYGSLKRYLMIFGILCFLRVHSQNPSVDSLKLALQNPKLHDTTRLGIIDQIIANASKRSTEAIQYNAMMGEIALRNLKNNKISKPLRDTYYQYLAYYYCDKALNMLSVKESQEALGYIDKAIAIFRYLKDEVNLWATVTNKGNCLRKIGAYREAIECYYQALKHQEAAGDMLGAASTIASIAQVYDDQDNFQMTISYYLKAIGVFEKTKGLNADSLYEKAILLHNLGYAYYKSGDYEAAEKYLLQAEKLDLENGFHAQLGFTYDKIGKVYIKQKKYDAAMKMFNRGLQFAETDRAKVILLESIGELYFIEKQYVKAAAISEKALQIAEGIKENVILGKIYDRLYQIYKGSGQYTKALKMHEMYVASKEAENIEASKNAMTEQKLQYEFEKKELNAKLAQEKKLSDIKVANERESQRKSLVMYVILMLLFLLGASIIFLYKFFRQKNIINANKNNELNQKLLITQMNPHFIFNSIDNIQSLIYNKQDKEAVKYLTKFSKLTRQILENSNENYIPLSEELTMIDNYLVIQQLLYNSTFKFSITVDEGIDIENILLPPMLTQPFIENAIKHGIRNKDEDGMITILFSFKEAKLLFEVRDNGGGFGTVPKDSNHKSLAIAITRERLINYSKNADFMVQAEDVLDQYEKVVGAKVVFEIPYIYEN